MPERRRPYSRRMPLPHPAPLPPQALLARYQRDGGYADCYGLDLPQPVSHEAFVAAFYTTRLFKLERLLLRWLMRRPSTDLDAQALAAGRSETFAAWTVEARAPDQLLLCDVHGRTRSWLMVAPAAAPGSTRLYFGSAVVPLVRRATRRPRMGLLFHALLGFHRLYSRALLVAAARGLAGRTLGGA